MQNNVLEAARDARVIFVIGSKDSGKTTFVTELANELFHKGYSVGVIDADVGQSDIGPPTTVGLGLVASPLTTLRDAVLQHLYFVGATTPKGHLLPLVIGTRKMLDKALACAMQKILIDTTGLVSGELGRLLKTQKIDLAAPDLIVCLQNAQECEHILQAYAAFERPKILRCTPAPQCRSKSVIARRKYREKNWRRYFSQAREIACSLSDIGLFEFGLFSGQPISAQTQQQIQAILALKESQQSPLSQPERVKDEPVLLWGEYSEDELHLVATRKLKYEHILTIKARIRHIRYVKYYTPEEFRNLLVGILDTHNECRALGILRAIDFQSKRATLLSPVRSQEIAGLKFSRARPEGVI